MIEVVDVRAADRAYMRKAARMFLAGGVSLAILTLFDPLGVPGALLGAARDLVLLGRGARRPS